MAGSTGNPLNLYLPGGGSLGIGGQDEVADIDKLNQNFQGINTFATDTNAAIAALGSSGRIIGTDPERLNLSGPALREGLLWYSTDVDREWLYTGSSWKLWSAPVLTITDKLNSGFGGPFAARLNSGVVEIAGNLTGTFPSAVSTTDVFSGLPAAYRPAGVRMGAAGAGGFAGSIVVRADGTGGIWQRSGTAWTTAQVTVTYLVP